MIVQALKALGRDSASQEDFILQLSARFNKKDWTLIEKATKNVAHWMKEVIKKAKELSNDEYC